MGDTMSKTEEVSAVEEFLSLDSILEVDDTKYATVEVPEWKGAVRIGSLKSNQVLLFVESNEDPVQKRTSGLRLLVESLVDKNGKRLCTEENRQQLIERFKNKDYHVVNRLVEEVLKLNGMTVKAQADAKNGSGEVVPAASPSVLH